MIQVLMVCLGNICRSPMAENVLRHKIQQAGLSQQIQVDSAGTAGYHIGELAHPRTRETLQKHAIPYSGTARQFSKRDLEQFDYVLAMDEDNLNDIQRYPQTAGTEIALFLSYANQADLLDESEVPDPYYTGVYDYVYELVDKGSEAFLAYLRQKHQL